MKFKCLNEVNRNDCGYCGGCKGIVGENASLHPPIKLEQLVDELKVTKVVADGREYRQENPRDQMVMLLQSVQGDVSNIRDGIVPRQNLHTVHARIDEALSRAMILLRKMPSGSWKDFPEFLKLKEE